MHPAMFVRMDQRRAFRESLLLGLALTAFSLTLHFLPIWETMLNRGAETWDGKPLPHDFIDACVQEHRLGPEAAFARRPLMTWSIDVVHALGVPQKTAFIILGSGLFFVCGLLVRMVASAWGSTRSQAMFAQIFFHLSPTVLFAWFDPMYTYDEPIQYAALLLASLALARKSTWGFIAAFTVALIARETSVLLLPGFLLLTERGRGLMFLLPLTLHGIFLFFFMRGTWLVAGSLLDLHERPSFFSFNFSDARMAGESICYLLLASALPVFLLWRHSMSKVAANDRVRLRAFWTTLVLNTIVVLVAAKAREARLFALPLIIGWPLLGKAVAVELGLHGGWERLFSFLRKPLPLAGFISGAAIIVLSVRSFFHLSTGIQEDNLFHEYLIGELLLILVCLFADHDRGRSQLRPA